MTPRGQNYSSEFTVYIRNQLFDCSLNEMYIVVISLREHVKERVLDIVI